MKSDPAETLIEDLQTAYQEGSGVHPSNELFVYRKWHRVARHILSGIKEKVSFQHLAVELHQVFIGPGHKTEIEHRSNDDPAVLGWFAVARRVLKHQETLQSLPEARASCDCGALKAATAAPL